MIARKSGATLEQADTVDAAILALARGANVEMIFCDVAQPVRALI